MSCGAYCMVRKGFSLLEILVVIVILSLLAVFGHSTYLGYVERAKVNEALNLLEEYQTAAINLRARSGTIAPYYVLFSDSDQTGLITGSPASASASKQVNLKYVNTVAAFTGTDTGGNTYILLGAQLQHDNVAVDDADFVYIAGIQTPSGVLTWACGISISQANTLDPEYLPKTCQSTLP